MALESCLICKNRECKLVSLSQIKVEIFHRLLSIRDFMAVVSGLSDYKVLIGCLKILQTRHMRGFCIHKSLDMRLKFHEANVSE